MKPASEKRTRAWTETRFSNFQLANSGRVNLLQARGQWKEGDRGLGLRKTKPEA